MGIIIIELSLIGILVIKLKKNKVNINRMILFALLLQVFLLMIYRFDLMALGRIVYYSDAEEYWKNTLTLLNGGKLIGNQTGYAKLCMLIQMTSPVRSVVWNNISNLLLLDNAVLLLMLYGSNHNVNPSNIKMIAMVTMINPLVIYGLMRNLKDALFIFLAVVMLGLYLELLKEFHIGQLLLLLFCTVFISTVRPWGFLILLAFILCTAILNAKNKIKTFAVIIGFLLVFLVLLRVTGLWSHVELWLPIVTDKASKLSLMTLITAPLKILTGPGIWRSLNGERYFLFYTDSGNIMSAVGAAMWWYYLACLVVQYKKFKFTDIGKLFLSVWLLFMLIYSLQYGGSLELRFRSVIYIITTAVVAYNSKSKIKLYPNMNKIIIFIGLIIFGTIASI